MATIRYIDLKQLGLFERIKVKSVTAKYAAKLERDLPKLDLVLHCKKYEKDGAAAKYSFSAKSQKPVLFATQASDWDLATALHKVMGKLERAVQKKLKTLGQKQGKILVKKGKKRKR